MAVSLKLIISQNI